MIPIQAAATREDVIALYRLLLGREPEDEAVVAAATGHPLIRLIEGFLDSEERARRETGLLLERWRTRWPSGLIAAETDAATLATLFERARDVWTRLGEDDAFWSVLTDPAYRATALDDGAEARFFESGAEDVAAFEAACARNGLAPPRSGRVLDFGCGVGRLGLHLARRFDAYLGVDISAPHLAEAQARITHGKAAFRLLPDFLDGEDRYDVAFSLLVLQHNAPPVMAELLRRLIERLNPGGIGYVQIPHALHDYAYSPSDPVQAGGMEMHALPHHQVFRLLAEGGARPVEAAPDGRAGLAGLSTTWLFVRD